MPSCAADLINDASALSDQSLANAMQGLQVELFGSLRCHKLHRRTLHRFCDRLRIAEVVLLSLRVWAHILRRHQSGVVAKSLQLPTEVMRTDASFHADQAPRHIGQPCFDLATRPFLTQHNSTAVIQPYDVE